MEIKTCEEYVLNELERVKNSNLELEEEVGNLKEKIKKLTSVGSINIIDEQGTAYFCDVLSFTNYNYILQKYDLTPDFLKDCLNSSILLDEWMSLDLNSFKVGEIVLLNYDFKITYNDFCAVAKINDAKAKWLNIKCIDNSNYFLDKDACKEAVKNLAKSNIKSYFEMGIDGSFKKQC